MIEPAIDLSLDALLPHRGAMLLLTDVLEVDGEHSVARVTISRRSSFYEPDKGVPAWIGLEYMGQTAALIAGYQRQAGQLDPHIGLFLGTRKYQSETDWFAPDSQLIVRCMEKAVSQGTLATFSCTISGDRAESSDLARAVLSVYRQPV